MNTFEGHPVPPSSRLAIVAARFNRVVTAKLVEGACRRLTELGVRGDAARRTGVPVIFGVLTTDSVEQALQRTGPGTSAGAQAAETALRMAHLMNQLPSPDDER